MIPAALQLGQIYQELGQWQQAEALFRRVIAASPKLAEGHFALGWLFMEQGQFNPALTSLQKATRLDPQHGQAWLRLAQLYDHLQRPKQAGRAYQQATALLSAGSLHTLQAQRRLNILQPALPRRMGNSWAELLRQMSGPILICLLAALLDAGLRPWWIPLSSWLALLLASFGAFLWVSGNSLPQNPLLSALLAEEEQASSLLQQGLTILGMACWLLAFSLILLPINQPFPELPGP
jgi:tetratricopeptide (TPR) repeat protein